MANIERNVIVKPVSDKGIVEVNFPDGRGVVGWLGSVDATTGTAMIRTIIPRGKNGLMVPISVIS